MILLLVAAITLNQPAIYGSDISFTVVYPQEAARQSRQPQYPDQPTTQVDCWQTWIENGQWVTYRVFTANQSTNPKTKKKVANGWWTAQTYSIRLTSIEGYNGFPAWHTDLPADCIATLYSFDVNNQPHIWAQTSFTVP